MARIDVAALRRERANARLDDIEGYLSGPPSDRTLIIERLREVDDPRLTGALDALTERLTMGELRWADYVPAARREVARMRELVSLGGQPANDPRE